MLSSSLKLLKYQLSWYQERSVYYFVVNKNTDMKKEVLLIFSLSILVLISCGESHNQYTSDTSTSNESQSQEIHTSSTLNSYTITWDMDGTISTETYKEGELPNYKGETIKDEDNTYSYSFAGWEPSIDVVSKDITYTAKFDKTFIEYNVTWIVDGISTTEIYHYRDIPSFKGSLNIPNSDKYIFTFQNWDKELEPVTRDITYTAIYTSTIRKYNIKFIVDGVETSKEIEYGTIPDYGSIPTKQSNEQFEYTFDKWEPQLSEVTGPQTYVAKFLQETRKYNITWNYAGKSETNRYEYGQMPTPPKNVEKDPSDRYTYTFLGWDKNIEAVTGDTVYTALYNESKRKYTVTYTLDGEVYFTEEVEYGQKPKQNYMVNPSKENLDFKGWKIGDRIYDELPVVTDNISYDAAFCATITVTPKNIDGKVLGEDIYYSVNEGSIYDISAPNIDGLHPNKPYLKGIANYNKSIEFIYSELNIWDGKTSTSLEGDGTEQSPYLIQSGADLYYFKNQVDSGNTYQNEYIKLTTSIQLNDTFTRIGLSNQSFLGTFDGNNCSIIGYSYLSTAKNAGLFFGIGSGSTIKNLCLNATTSGITYSSLLVGQVIGGNILNCSTYGSLKQGSGNAVGAICGGVNQGGKILNCENYASVESTTSSNNKTSGICGFLETKGKNIVENCNNFANVKGYSNVAGVVAEIANNASTSFDEANQIISCHNYGDISSFGSAAVTGGVVATTTNGKIINSTNYGNIISSPKGTSNAQPVGGIIGQLKTKGIIDNCINYGVIKGALRVGGIIGNNGGSLSNCTNNGDVIGGDGTEFTGADKGCWIGGIVGVALNGSSISSSINNGTVKTDKLFVGGILGCVGSNTNTSIIDCINNGNITTSKNGAGGILGGTLGTTSVISINESVNNGNIYASDKIGGIAGCLWTADSSINGCENNGNISYSSNASYYGDIIGQNAEQYQNEKAQ